jgi:hypothetical protein
VRHREGEWWPYVDWSIGDSTARCAIADVDGVRRISAAVVAAKHFLGGGAAGGAFTVNEFGQVLVPSSAGDGRTAIAAQLSGPLMFHNAFEDGALFDLANYGRLQLGDAWSRPYLGIPFHLSNRGEIYFWKEESWGGHKEVPRSQDAALVEALRTVRPWGAVRFIVGYGGVVLTKQRVIRRSRNAWEPIFVGHLDYANWYSREA